jgi:hypothetical protein
VTKLQHYSTFDETVEAFSKGDYAGIHIFILADEFTCDSECYYINNRNNHVEVYAPDADVTVPIITAPGSLLSDENAYTKASKSKQGEKFIVLWNCEIPKGKSPSEADMALAEILAFWCGGDIEQMGRLFRRSGLMCDKWGRVQRGSIYGMILLTKTMEKCSRGEYN